MCIHTFLYRLFIVFDIYMLYIYIVFILFLYVGKCARKVHIPLHYAYISTISWSVIITNLYGVERLKYVREQ